YPIDTDDEWPEVQVGLEGGIFEADSAQGAAGRPRHEVPIGSVNAEEYAVVSAVLDETSLVELLNSKKRWRGVEYGGGRALPKAKVETVRPGGEKNRLAQKSIKLDTLLSDGTKPARGVVAVGVHFQGPRGEHNDARVLDVTDLGVSAKMSRFGSVVWVTR